ncbi:hypothetical protein D3C72_1250050 [compost metagenome]
MAIGAHFAADRVEHQRADFDQGLRLARAPPAEGAHARREFGQFKGFGDVIVGAGVQARNAVFDAVARGKDQYGDLIAVLAQLPQHIKPAHAGQI